MDLHGYQALTWSLTAVVLVAFAGFAMLYAFVRRRRHAADIKFNQEEFITARRQVGMLRIGWSFFAGALGAWVIASPPSYVGSGYGYGAGAIGLVFYSLSSGLPVIMIAFAGEIIRRKVPHVLSLTDFMGWRYGWVAKTYIGIFCMFNMAIALLAEYTTIGLLFGVYLGSKDYAIIVTVGVLTMLYTTYGGLFVSIITDQIQGVAATLMFTVCVCYIAAKFRSPLPSPFPSDCCDPYSNFDLTPEQNCPGNPEGFCITGKNKAGYSSIFVMPASLFTATVFSEAMWQRAWASADRKALVRGSILGCVGIVLVVFFVGFCGLLAAWGSSSYAASQLITDNTNYNLYFFSALGAINENNNISSGIGVVVMLLAVCMNMSAVDSLQNGLAAAVSSHLLKGRHVAWTKLAVLIINVPLIAVGTQNYNVLQLFLLANMLCCTTAIPVLLGLSERLHAYLGGASMIASSLWSIFCTSWYGVDYFHRNFADINAVDPATYPSNSFNRAMHYTWIGNGYAWDFFLVPLCVSLGSMILCAAVNWALQRFHRQPAVPGFTAPATHPALFPPTAAESEEDSLDGDKASGSSGQFMEKRESEDAPAAPAVAVA